MGVGTSASGRLRPRARIPCEHRVSAPKPLGRFRAAAATAGRPAVAACHDGRQKLPDLARIGPRKFPAIVGERIQIPELETAVSKVAFLGLGVMGFPMAGHLKRAGHDVVVYNRTAAVAARWVGEYGGSSAPTPAAASAERDFVLSCVGNDDDVRAITLGDDGAFAGMRAGAIFIDHTTASATLRARTRRGSESAEVWGSSTRRFPEGRPGRRTVSSPSCAAATTGTTRRRSR